MYRARIEPTYDAWHAQARALLSAQVPPSDVVWVQRGDEQPLLDDLAQPAPVAAAGRITVPRKFVDAARLAARHSSPARWALLYRILWRIARGERALLDDELDDDVRQLRGMLRGVREDVERMKAFVRFRAIGPAGGERFIAWHVPDHDVVELVAPHFAKRYPNMRWSIFTPQHSVHWDGTALTVDAGVPASAIPTEDTDRSAQALWRAYYAASFNPARVNEKKLGRDIPERFRAQLPEAAAIPSLIAQAPARTSALRAGSNASTSRAQVPVTTDLAVLRGAAAGCTGCDLFKHATQTVFGEGARGAAIVLIGEQPGDAEDRAGRPFIGPAGEMLDRALADAGIPRGDVYVTNAVKHFAWEPRGKRRIHRTPRLSEVRACRPWLEAELASVRPKVIVCLGGTSAQALLGPQARVNALRGRVIEGQSWARSVVVTYHPAAILRAEDAAAQQSSYGALVADLMVAARAARAV